MAPISSRKLKPVSQCGCCNEAIFDWHRPSGESEDEPAVPPNATPSRHPKAHSECGGRPRRTNFRDVDALARDGSRKIPNRTSPRIIGSIMPSRRSLRLNQVDHISRSGLGLVASHSTLASTRQVMSGRSERVCGLRFDRHEPALQGACEKCVYQSPVPRRFGKYQAIFASIHPFYIKRLAWFDIVLVEQFDRYDDLPLRGNDSLHEQVR